MYAVGQTGTGKTTMLKSMILSDINNGEGVCVIDPHGDLFKEILGKIPKHRANDVVLIDPMDSDYPVGLNMLECQLEIQRHFIGTGDGSDNYKTHRRRIRFQLCKFYWAYFLSTYAHEYAFSNVRSG